MPSSDLNVDLPTFIDIVAALLDVPVYKSRIQTVHLIFSLFSEFKNSEVYKYLTNLSNLLINILETHHHLIVCRKIATAFQKCQSNNDKHSASESVVRRKGGPRRQSRRSRPARHRIVRTSCQLDCNKIPKHFILLQNHLIISSQKL